MNAAYTECASLFTTSPPTVLEVLGDHLFIKVQELEENLNCQLDAAKITGVLLELGEREVLMLLQKREALEKAVTRVLNYVPDAVDTPCSQFQCQTALDLNVGVSSHYQKQPCDPYVADDLYDRVMELEPRYSSHITGMLLELETAELQSLLKSPEKLVLAVSKAKSAIMNHN